MRPRLRLVSTIVALAAIYFETGHLGLKLASVHPSASPVWPPTGIAFAALLICGLQAWPGILIGAFLVNVTVDGQTASSIAIACGNTLEAVVGAELATRFANGRDFFRQPRALLRFVLFSALLSTMISATVGVSTLAVSGLATLDTVATVWIHWWLGDATGALLLTPLILAWYGDPRPDWSGRRGIECLLLLGTLLLFGATVFGAWSPSESTRISTAFLAMPILLWPACRLGKRETVTAIFIMFLLALCGTLRGLGPFASATPNGTLLSLQTFVGVVAVTSMGMAASTAERRRTTAELVRYQRELEGANARLNEQCLSDALTGISNRRSFQLRLVAEVARVKRHPSPLSLLIIDVDRFRQHNQILGHGGADLVLRRIATLLSHEIRASDHLARYGGDEFVILLPDTDLSGARVIAERCRRSVAASSWDKRSVTISVGVAAFRADGGLGEDLVADADEALFRAKFAGRNRVSQGSGGRQRTGTIPIVPIVLEGVTVREAGA